MRPSVALQMISAVIVLAGIPATTHAQSRGDQEVRRQQLERDSVRARQEAREADRRAREAERNYRLAQAADLAARRRLGPAYSVGRWAGREVIDNPPPSQWVAPFQDCQATPIAYSNMNCGPAAPRRRPRDR